MFRDILPIFLSLAIALFGGIYVTDEVTRNFDGFGVLELDGWIAHPSAGSRDADPYARARAARTGRIALGSAEGLAFIAKSDSDGQPINAGCSYIISGKTAAARAWTLRVTDDQLATIARDGDDAYQIHSGNVLRDQDGVLEINASSTPSPGNWLPFGGIGDRYFVLTLYDTGVASTTGVSNFRMPTISRVRCDD